MNPEDWHYASLRASLALAGDGAAADRRTVPPRTEARHHMYDKKGREKLGRIGADIQKIIDVAKAENNRGLTSDEREKFHALETDYTRQEARITANEAGGQINELPGIEELRDTYRTSRHDQRELYGSPHDQAFSTYLRHGINALDDDQRGLVLAGADIGAMSRLNFKNVTSTTAPSQGGVLIPAGFAAELVQAMRWFGGIDGVVAEFRTDSGNPWPYPTVDDTSNQGRIIGQNVQVTQTDPVFSSVTFQAYIGSSDLCLIPISLMEDSYFDLNRLIADLLGTRLGRLLNNKCTVGTGTNEPTGIVTDTVAAGNILTLATGSTTAIAYNDLVNLEHAVNPAYRYNPATRFMFSDAVLKLLKKLVDSSARPLWQPGLTASFRDGAAVDLAASKPTILDHPYIINQDMASPAANAYSMIFGDLNNFKLRKVGTPTVLRLVERYADWAREFFFAPAFSPAV
jgi:HK97 family phage major capsid protein